MLTSRGQVQIADFGLSVHNVHLDNGGGASCDRTGTPGYMAPELFAPEELRKKLLRSKDKAASPAANEQIRRRLEFAAPRELAGHAGDRFASLLFQKVDVYSFAMVLWELFSGRSIPKILRGQNAWDVIRRQALERQRPNLALLSSSTPKDLVRQ